MAARQQQLSGASCRPFSDTLSWVDLYEQIGITDYVEYKKKGRVQFWVTNDQDICKPAA